MHARATSEITGGVNFGEGDDALFAYDGTLISGLVDFGEGGESDGDILYLKSSGNPEYSSTIHFTNEEKIAPDDDLIYFVNDHNAHSDISSEESKPKSLIVVDRSEQAVKATVLNTFTSSIHNVINKRLDHVTPGSSRFWTDYYNTYRQREEERRVFAYDQRINGVISGFEHIFKNVRIGLMGGFSQSDVEANSRSFKTETDSYFAGLYGIYNNKLFDLQVSFVGGRESHENTRMIRDGIAGTERATADFYSNFISPSVKVSTSISLTKRLSLRPSAGVVYSLASYDDYRETGSSYSNLSMDNRTLDAFNWTGRLNLRYKIASWCNIDIYGGGNGRYTDDEGVRVTLGEQTKMIENNADTSVRSANVGGSINVDIHDQIVANFSYDHSEVSGGETRDNLTFGFNFNF
jgi:hypothetical protein